MSLTELPDETEFHSSMAQTATLLADVLAMADHHRLPVARHASLFEDGTFWIQLPYETGSIDAVRRWASAFCGVMRSDIREDEGGPSLYVRTEFDFDGADVMVYAFTPVPLAEPDDSTEDDELPF